MHKTHLDNDSSFISCFRDVKGAIFSLRTFLIVLIFILWMPLGCQYQSNTQQDPGVESIQPINPQARIIYTDLKKEDLIKVKNTSGRSLDMGGYALSDGHNIYTLPHGTSTLLAQNEILTVWFLSPKVQSLWAPGDIDKFREEKMKEPHTLVCTDFGFSSDEEVILYDASRNVVDKVTR